MDRKKVEFGVALGIIVLLILLVLFLLMPKEQKQVDDQPDVTGDVPHQVEEEIIPTTVDSRTKESPPNVIARVFVERFGSYSTEAELSNVEDVKALATASLDSRLEQLMTEASTTTQTAYYGVSTRVISIDEVEIDEAAATYDVNTQRTESFDSPANTQTRYQQITVNLEKVGNQWLVSNFTWAD